MLVRFYRRKPCLMLEFQEYNQLAWVPSFTCGKPALPVQGTRAGTQLYPRELSWEHGFAGKMLFSFITKIVNSVLGFQ